jgi:NADH-quinone oxidoreductase subunit I
MILVDHIKNLLKGLGIAGKHLGRHAITLQYPEERMEMPERSRGIVVLLSDKETGELNCTSCELCMRACPTAAIKIVTHRDENKKKILDEFVVENGLCCFCGLCEEACNFSALKMATKYEFSTLDKDDLIWDKDKLQQVGRDVDYVDTRKKKKTVTDAAPDTEKKIAPVAKSEETQAAQPTPDKVSKPAEQSEPTTEPTKDTTAQDSPKAANEPSPEGDDKKQGGQTNADA